jgi:hypothetical protein
MASRVRVMGQGTYCMCHMPVAGSQHGQSKVKARGIPRRWWQFSAT